MDTEIAASVSGPGWTAQVESLGHTQYAIVYRQAGGSMLRVVFDPREDGPNVFTNLDVWTEPANKTVLESEKPQLIERLSQALDAYFKNDSWRLWTATWPRFPLAWKGSELFIIEHAPNAWLQYSEKGRGIVLPSEMDPDQATKTSPQVRVHNPKKLVWTFPPGAGVIPAADWQHIQSRLEQSSGLNIEWV